jgi:hypothetical protein
VRALTLDARWKSLKAITLANKSPLLLALNIVGAVIYLIVASPSWAIPDERAAGLNSITGEPFIWFLGIAPVITIFIAINLAWGVSILRHRLWPNEKIWLVAAAVWLAAVVIDFAHH